MTPQPEIAEPMESEMDEPTKLYGLPRLQAEYPLVFELAAQIRRDLAEIDEATAVDIERMKTDGAPIEDLAERSRRGKMMGEALRQELEAISRNLTEALAAYEPAPFVIPATDMKKARS